MATTMDKLIAFLDRYFVPYAAKVANQTHLQAIRDGLVMSMSLIIVGSVFLIIGNLPIPGYPGFMASIFGSGWKQALSIPVNATFGLLGLLVSVGVAYRLAEKYSLDAITSAIASVTAFMIVSPYDIQVFIKELDKTIDVAGINLNYMGAKGMFVSIIMAIISVEIMRFFVKRGIVIKMPESVPSAVSKSFTALVPILFIILFALLVRVGIEKTSWENLHVLIQTFVSKPLLHAGGSYWGAMLTTLFISLLWAIGLHGSTIVQAVMMPIWLTLMDQNRVAFEAGQELPNVVTFDFFYFSTKMGGAGSTLILVLFMAFWAKSQHLKEIGKLSIVPGIFNINEPVIFGVPIVLNPLLLMPFIIAPLVATTTTYFAMATDLVPRLTGVTLPWTTPVGVYGFLATNGSFSAVILTVFNLLIVGAIYYPFFKVFDKQKCQEEMQNQQDETLIQQQ
ncbi:PTS cellobiose transporter subunit IIC [Hafnia psychrotolerans]|uniref:Permease IIC component n=1 Tax=Hafnia psychrotolerans TaxID=1477018 RepID=A0ABQ1GKG3_9GAMM|nr:PTS cellobiose transporter subunit IIC [Hafnia psychrotolerans]GGA45366.1 permease IIC component [Hafnia psychrotolerans]